MLILRVQVIFVRRKIKEQTTALFAGGELSEEDQAAFIKEMEALFLDAKEDAKKFTPKKYGSMKKFVWLDILRQAHQATAIGF